MLLSSVPLKNYQNVNSFERTTEWIIRSGDATILYFQLIDLDQDGLRYLPLGSSPGIQVTFPGPTPLIKTATPVNANDLSLWQVSILSSEVVNGGNVWFNLTESGVSKKWIVIDSASVESTGASVGGC